MKILHCAKERDYIQKTVYSDGGFAYEYESDFAKGLPAALGRCSVAGGCTDPEGNVYLAMRDPGQIVKLTPSGQFVKAFGGEILDSYIHFIYYHQGHKTIICTNTHGHEVLEFDLDGNLFRRFGEHGRPSDTGMDMGTLARMRRDGKLFPTEPYLGVVPMWAFYVAQQGVKRVAGPFNMPTDAGVTRDRMRTPRGRCFWCTRYVSTSWITFGFATGKRMPSMFLTQEGTWWAIAAVLWGRPPVWIRTAGTSTWWAAPDT